ncbi:MAG: hypothetical protein GQ559_00530 [Desulfobulbaceae bacterium]|nr:hypothetical protein [Desulfobulbaceae bacterium]
MTPYPRQLQEPASEQLSGIERGMAIGIEPLTVAAYLDRPQIVTRATAHKLTLSEANMWAEPLKESILRVIAVNLSNMLDTNRVFRIPRRNQSIPLAFRVAIAIARFDGALGGDAQLTARWTLYSLDDKPLMTRVTIITEPAGGAGYDNLIAAQNRSLKALSLEIAESIKSNSK